MHIKLISSKNDEEDHMYLIHVLHINLQEVDVWSEITIIINTCVNMIIFLHHDYQHNKLDLGVSFVQGANIVLSLIIATTVSMQLKAAHTTHTTSLMSFLMLS